MDPVFVYVSRRVQIESESFGLKALGGKISFKSVTLKNASFWDVTPCISCVNRRTLKMEAMPSSETSIYTRSTRQHIPEGGILLI
jgi:hypothetical protein